MKEIFYDLHLLYLLCFFAITYYTALIWHRYGFKEILDLLKFEDGYYLGVTFWIYEICGILSFIFFIMT